MNSVREIVQLTGGWDALAERPVTVRVDGFMPLCIEIIGRGRRGGVLLSVAHYHEQNGDLMRDPELVVEVTRADWLPVSYRQDGLGLLREVEVTKDGVAAFDHLLAADLVEFMGEWDRNVRDQGFVAAVGG